MMLAAAKPATPSRGLAREIGGILSELGGFEAGAGQRLDQLGRLQDRAVHRGDALGRKVGAGAVDAG